MAPEPVERKLAAILSADVVGYSRLMADDEAATIRTLSDYREEIAMRVRQHRGRVVDAPGDNVLAEFPTALDAVRCAVEIQGVLRALNASLSNERRMDFRIGVHMGDVAAKGARIYGDGVNIAARLEELAEAGGVCISATVHEQVRNKLDVGFTDLGDQTVKNIPNQIHVYRVQPGGQAQAPLRASGARPRRLRTALVATAAVLLLLGVGLWASWPRPLGLLIDLAGVGAPPVEPALPENVSIAVLPFTNMSGDPEQEYFSDGITEDLTTELARLPELFVIARNTAFQYKGQRVDVEKVGRELGVRYLLEGSVRKSGDRVRITAQLIDATTGGHVWSQRYDRELSDVFAIQSEITEEILGALNVEIGAAEAQRLARKPPQDFTVMEANWKGLYHLNRLSRKDNQEARRLFERAIELEPGVGWSYAFLGNTYLLELANGWSSDSGLVERAEELGRRAVEVDGSLPAGHVTLAGVHIYRERPEAAVIEAERGIELAPNDAGAHAIRGVALAQAGRFLEASRSIKRALRLNPQPDSLLLMFTAYVNYGAARKEQAIELMERVRTATPENVTIRTMLAVLYEQAGRHADAQTAIREGLAVRPDLTAEQALALIPGFETLVGPEEFAEAPGLLRTAGLP